MWKQRLVRFAAWPVAAFVLVATGFRAESGGTGELVPFLVPSENINSDHPAVQEKAKELVKECRTDMERARALYQYVRDSYNLQDCKGYVASEVLECGGNSCRQRSILLAALARAVNIPARLQLQRVVIKAWKTDDGATRDITFAHSIVALYLEQRWVLYEPVGNRDKWRLWTQDEVRADEMPLPFVPGEDCLFTSDDRILIETLPVSFVDHSPEMVDLIRRIDDYQ
jgi:hypothetical protein